MSKVRRLVDKNRQDPASGLLNIIHPSNMEGWRDTYRSGWLPGWFNQQWGGAQHAFQLTDSLTGAECIGDVATGYIGEDTAFVCTDAVARTWTSSSFVVSETMDLSYLWLKLYKVGNPSNSVLVTIVSDDGTNKPNGTTPITNGSADPISMRVLTTHPEGQWYRFVFSTPTTLSAGTRYHIVVKSSGAVSSSNYIAVKGNATKPTYAHNNVVCRGDASAVWTAYTNNCFLFYLQNSDDKSFLQASDIDKFDGQITFNEGTPINQSKILRQPLSKFFRSDLFTYMVRCKLSADGVLADFLWGLDHNRVLLYVDTGDLYVKVFDSTGTSSSVLHPNAVTFGSGLQDIAVSIRAKDDGNDYIHLTLNGVTEAVDTLSIPFSLEFARLGTAWVGGGFPISLLWDSELDMNSSPSSQGWAWGGTASEGTAFFNDAGILYQTKSGYASTQNGYYSKNPSLDNAVGWAVYTRLRVNESSGWVVPGASSGGEVSIHIADNLKYVVLNIQHSYIQTQQDLGVTDYVYFHEGNQLKTFNESTEFLICGKGSDYYVFVNGGLAIDGTGKLTTSSSGGLNGIYFGDTSISSNKNASVQFFSFKYLNTGMALPSALTGGSLYEAAFWSGDQTNTVLDLYSPTPSSRVSIKDYCGLSANYVYIDKSFYSRITPASFATSSITFLPVPELDIWYLGSSEDSTIVQDGQQSTLNAGQVTCRFLGTLVMSTARRVHAAAPNTETTTTNFKADVGFGLHYAPTKVIIGSGIGTFHFIKSMIEVTP